MKYNIAYTLVTLTLTLAAAACHATASGVATDTKANTTAVKAGIETLDVKTAIIDDATIDAGAIDVDTFGDKKLVVIRGSVPTQAQKTEPGRSLPSTPRATKSRISWLWFRPRRSECATSADADGLKLPCLREGWRLAMPLKRPRSGPRSGWSDLDDGHADSGDGVRHRLDLLGPSQQTPRMVAPYAVARGISQASSTA